MTALQIAIGEIGTAERPVNSNNVKYNTWYYGRAVQGAAYPWCMAFVQWVYAQAGNALPYKTASCSALLNWYRANQPGYVVSSPQPGDIVIYTFGHTGIVETVGASVITAIEGNTGIGNDTNGGTVMRRTREKTKVQAYIRPKTSSTGGGNMDVVKGSNTSETAMIKAIQAALGANVDGEIGTQTMSDIACRLNADCFPLTLKLYGAPVIIAKNIVPFAGNGNTLSGFTNVINGSFYANGKPCSILIQDGKVKQRNACHASYSKPESVLYRLWSGGIGFMRAIVADTLPKDVRWAVGGLGLLNYYDPAAEGFCKLTANGKTEDFSDVLRKTNHTMLGYRNGYFYLVYCSNMTAAGVNAFAKTLGLAYAVMLDGGHVAGINGAEKFAKINTGTKQYYMIQGEKVK